MLTRIRLHAPVFCILVQLLTTATFAQVPITFTFRTDTSRVAEPKKDSKPHIVQVQASALPATTIQVQVTDLLTGDASPSLDYGLSPNPIMLTFGPGYQLIQTVAIEIKADDKTEPKEAIDLSLTVPAGYNLGTHGKHTVMLSDPDEKTPTIPMIRIATGTNFDYLNQAVELKNLFFGFEVFAPTAFSNKKESVLSGFHIGFGWSQNFSSVNDGIFIPGGNNLERNADDPLRLFSTIKPINRISADCTLVLRRFYQRNSTINVNNFTFFGSTMSRFWQSTDKTLDVFAALRFEGIQRRVRFNDQYTVVDSAFVRLNRRFGDIAPFDPTKQLTRDASYYDFYVSVGTPIRWEPADDVVEIRFSPMIGWGGLKSPFHQDSNGDIRPFFYLVQLSIIEKKFGIRLGGEVRGSISNGNVPPYYTVTLSKVFTFRKFEDYLTLKKND